MTHLMTNAVRRWGTAPAVKDAVRELTYQQVEAVALSIAHRLESQGIGPGSRVAVMCTDEALTVPAYLGVWYAGAAVVHVNVRLAAPEVAYIVRDSAADAICHSQALEPAVTAATAGMTLRAVVSLEQVIPDHAGTANPAVQPAPDDIAIIGYTSGTSGRPKGAIVSHRTLSLSTRISSYSLSMPRRSRLAYTGSVSFVGSFWGQVLPHLYIGGMVNFLGHYDIDSWFAAMRKDRSTYTYVATPMMMPFAEQLTREPSILDHLETVLHTGSAAPREHVEAVLRACHGRYVEAYGSTEIVGTIASSHPQMYAGDSPTADLLSSAGTILPSAEAWIEHPDGRRAAPGEEGMIMARSDTLFSGYWGQPEATAAVLSPDGVFNTGDLGMIDEQGYLYFRGRHSELINSGGMNVYPAEVERVIAELPDVESVAVFGLPHERWTESVTAAIVRRQGSQLDDRAVIDHCRTQLASYKKPTRVMFVDALPLNPSRKVDKRQLKDIAQASDAHR